MKESENQAQIKAFLEDSGFSVYVTSSARKGWGVTPGIPDLIAFGLGCVLFVEVKSSTGKAKPEQEEFIDGVNSNNGYALVAREASDVFDFLVEWGIIESD